MACEPVDRAGAGSQADSARTRAAPASTPASTPAEGTSDGGSRGVVAAFGRMRDRVRARPALNAAYRAAVAVVGAGIIAGGVVLLPLPGPGWVIIFLGLGVLASEFEWARRLLHFARRQVAAWSRWVASQSVAVRVLIGLGCLLIVAGCVVGYFAWQGVPGWLPFIG